MAGPGGRFSLEPAADYWWLAADESAIPAVATLLEALPETAAADVHIEVDGPDDEVEFTAPAKTTISWHHRRRPEAFGAELADAARAATIPDGARVWVACEAAAMRDIRRYFIAERHLPAGLPGHPRLLADRRAEPPRPRLRRGLAGPRPPARPAPAGCGNHGALSPWLPQP